MDPVKSPNAVWHHATVTRARRERLNEHRSFVLWFTGLSGSGKSTLAHEVEERLHRQRRRTFVFDGDNVRHGLCAGLGFSANDRAENLRRIGEMAKLFVEAGIISLTAFISPYRSDRERIRKMFAPGDFYEIYAMPAGSVRAAGRKRHVPGPGRGYPRVHRYFRTPMRPRRIDLRINTGRDSLDDCIGRVLTSRRGDTARPRIGGVIPS